MTRDSVSRRIFMGGALAAIVAPAAAQAQVRVNIGVNLPAPPQLVPVPAAPAVEYAPQVAANYFLYDGEYYVFSNGAWYAGRGYNGPWYVVRPDLVPRPLLAVPVQYYRRPPVAWRRWRRENAPRWEARYGRRWQERHHEGQASPRERHEDRRDRGDDHRDGRDWRHDDRR